MKKEATKMSLSWSNLPQLSDKDFPDNHPGLAGALIGFSNDNLLIAGGSNFLDALPWNGGTKSYHKAIYTYNTAVKGSSWKKWNVVLPQNLGYSACVTVGNQIISVGGENETGKVNNVYSIEVGDTLTINELLAFPVKITNASTANINRQIYVVGGITDNETSSKLYRLDLKQTDKGWEALQDIPKAFANGVVVAQNDGNEEAIYVLGGRDKKGELTTFFDDVWKYLPSKNSWELVSAISNGNATIPLAAGVGAAYGNQHILLFSGDDGEKYNKTEGFINAANKEEDLEKKAQINKAKIEHLTSHPGFSKDVLAFNTIDKKWQKIGEIPQPAPVTTVLVKNNDTFFIANGEIKPGIRTPQVITVKIQK